MTDTQVMTIRIPAALHERLRGEAYERRVSMNAIVMEGIIWRVWNALSDGSVPSPVKLIARELGMTTADVAAIVYPAHTFGDWADDQEPDLPA